MRTIEIIIDRTGDLEIDAVGFKGADCEKATRFLEQALGNVANRRHKPEYHARTRTAAKQRIGQ